MEKREGGEDFFSQTLERERIRIVKILWAKIHLNTPLTKIPLCPYLKRVYTTLVLNSCLTFVSNKHFHHTYFP